MLFRSSKIPIRKSGGHIGNEIEITRDLNIPGKEGKYAGKVTVLCQLNPNEILLKEPDLGKNYSIFCFILSFLFCFILPFLFYFILFYFILWFYFRMIMFLLLFLLYFYFQDILIM